MTGHLPDNAAAVERVNREFELFCQSVSHELRAPLRAMDGLSEALLEDYDDKLDSQGKQFLRHIREASQRTARLVDDLVALSRAAQGDIRRTHVDMATMAREIGARLRATEPARDAHIVIEDSVVAYGDERLLRLALENLLGNAWKFSSKRSQTRIEFGCRRSDDAEVYFVRDNGEGFDMRHASRIFGAFQRLHLPKDFDGTGIGLAIVQRVVHRHGGQIWPQGQVDRGAMFSFTLRPSA
jgi:light-regulated signal transduction histidine kinase (bacteriophytochrome)